MTTSLPSTSSPFGTGFDAASDWAQKAIQIETSLKEAIGQTESPDLLSEIDFSQKPEKFSLPILTPDAD